MKEKKKKSNKVSIYLIKDEISYEAILKDYAYHNTLYESGNSVTYYYPTRPNPPEWLKSYFKIEPPVDISNSNSKVISLHKINIDGKEKIFAIPFGNGKSLLCDDVIEEQFGIKILLNSVSKDGFRQLCTSNYGGDHRTKNEQTPKKTDISEFGFDIHSDFLRRATAKSEEDLFNKNTITGSDCISVAVPVDITNINDFLIECYKRYLSDNYKKNFAWLDNIKEVKEKGLRLLLNEKLIEEINEKNFDKVWAAVPEVIEWERVSNFRYKVKDKGYDDIDIIQIVKLFNNEQVPNIETLKNRRVLAMNIDGDEPEYEWKIYDCLIGEVELNGCIYCLNYGKWYKLDNDFVTEINNYYNSIELIDTEYPNCKSEKEADYNKKLSKSLKDSILMDTKTIRVTGMGKSSIEVCDVLTNNNELIHVKKNGGSSYLSHLFNQAAVSGEMLLDERFREKANIEAGKNVFDADFAAKNFTIILAIITSKNTERPKIPFFSKVSIQYAIDGLIRKGYKVKLKNIFSE